MRLYSIRVGTIASVVFTLLLDVQKGHAAYYPVSPWTSPPLFTQDFGCIGTQNLVGMDSPIKDSDGKPFDICFKADGIHDGLDQIPVCSKPPSTCKDSDWEIRSTVVGTVVNDVKRDCVVDDKNDLNGLERKCYHGFGNTVVILGNDGKYHGFHHMVKGSIPSNIFKGATISIGQKLGVMGETGFVDGIHLHFSVWKVDPKLDEQEPAVNVTYKSSHPANFGSSIDPWTVLGTFDYRLLTVSASPAKIRRGPGKKYSVFGQATKNQTYVAFAYVDVTEEDHDLNSNPIHTLHCPTSNVGHVGHAIKVVQTISRA